MQNVFQQVAAGLFGDDSEMAQALKAWGNESTIAQCGYYDAEFMICSQSYDWWLWKDGKWEFSWHDNEIESDLS